MVCDIPSIALWLLCIIVEIVKISQSDNVDIPIQLHYGIQMAREYIMYIYNVYVLFLQSIQTFRLRT